MSNAQFESVNNEYLIAQEHIAEGEIRYGNLYRELENLKKVTDQCTGENELLSQQIEALNQTIKKKETVISLQMTVIRLFDDSKQTLQNSIQEQIASENL